MAKAATKAPKTTKLEDTKLTIDQLSELLMGQPVEAPAIEKKSIGRPTLADGRLIVPMGSTPLAIGVNLYKLAEEEKFSFNKIHSTCGTQLKQGAMRCPACEKEVGADQTAMGYKKEDGTFLVLSKEDKEACKVSKAKDIKIDRFVKASEVDAIYFASAEYMCPEDGVVHATYFEMLRGQLEVQGLVAIATLSQLGRQHTIIIRPFTDPNDATNKGLVAQYMYFENEIRSCNKWVKIAVDQNKAKVFGQIIARNIEAFQPEEQFDGYTENLRTKIDAMLKGTAVSTTVAAPKVADAGFDLMAALDEAMAAPKVAKKPRRKLVAA